MDLALALGGTITGEHGVGRLKKAWLPDYVGPDVMAVSRRIKDALDPQGILNPGADSVVSIQLFATIDCSSTVLMSIGLRTMYDLTVRRRGYRCNARGVCLRADPYRHYPHGPRRVVGRLESRRKGG